MNELLMALLGGSMIGLAATGMMLAVGRVAGISGILGGLLKPTAGEISWRLSFVLGLLSGGVVLVLALPQVFDVPLGRSLLAIAGAGALVGFGVRLGSGCTSGHGVCGLSRLSLRSLVATCTFMAAGVLTASVLELLLGGVL